jgi:flagellum-specific ATP synthase
MTEIVTPEHLKSTQRFKQVYSKYQQQRDLISVGAYQSGSDSATDEAILLYPQLVKFLQQGMHDSVTISSSMALLQSVLTPGQKP